MTNFHFVQTRDVHEAGTEHQGVARDVHGYRHVDREPGGDGQQVDRQGDQDGLGCWGCQGCRGGQSW